MTVQPLILADAQAIAHHVRVACDQGELVRRAVGSLRQQLRTETEEYALERLFNWNLRGVEWFNATSGWIFLKDQGADRLYSRRETAARTMAGEQSIQLSDARSIVVEVYKSREEYLSFDVPDDVARGRPFRELEVNSETRSELAVPILDPDQREVLGVYNLESRQPGAFTPVQARELRRNGALFLVHLLALRELDRLKATEQAAAEAASRAGGLAPEGGWCWHPEVHRWNPHRLLERFATTVVRSLAGVGVAPSCGVWYCDPDGLSWPLAVCGFDYDFLNLYALGPTSAIDRTGRAPDRRILRGTPASLGFEAARKAEMQGVRQAVLATLRVKNETLDYRGVLSLYSFDPETVLPGDDTVTWLVQQVEGLIEALYRLRVVYAKGHIAARLATSPSTHPQFRLFGNALSSVLPCDAASIYNYEPETNVLRREYKAGLHGGALREADEVVLKTPPSREQESITAHCWAHPNQAVRVNYGEDDPVYSLPNPPPRPNPSSYEPLTADASPQRRRLGVGVPSEDPTRPSWGVLRLYRTAKGLPFTRMDAGLLEEVANSYHCCKMLFWNHRYQSKQALGPFVVSPTSTLLEDVLRRAVKDFATLGLEIRQGAFFVSCMEARPKYRRFAYFAPERRLPPDERLAPLPEDSVGAAGWGQTHRISVGTWSGKERRVVRTGSRVHIPLAVFSGDYLVEGVLCLDFRDQPEFDAQIRARILRIGVEAAAMLGANRWMAPPDLDDDPFALLEAFRLYTGALRGIAGSVWCSTTEADSNSNLQTMPEPGMSRFGVRAKFDGTQLEIPLFVGPFKVAVLSCEAKEELSAPIRRLFRCEREKSFSYSQDVSRLHKLIGQVCGAWCRLVAPNVIGPTNPIWQIRFSNQDVSEGALLLWQERVRFRPLA